jgi:DNA-nicking Smr family endonuclease
MEKWSTPFKGLKKVLEARRREHRKIAPPPPIKETEETPQDDEACFRDAMKDVSEIIDFRELPASGPKKGPVVPQGLSEGDEVAEAHHELEKIVSKKSGITLSDTDEYIEWAAPSLSPHKRKELTRSLHEGVYAISDFIDLHGLIEDDAWDALGAFILEVRKRKLSCIKIIHGRGLRSPGEPVLKSAVERWLKGPLSKYVLAFATARACDGGLGATYVLLKR